ncbi:MAG: hypothetical protein ABIU29_06075 [Chthoniobacterales bacterium]
MMTGRAEFGYKPTQFEQHFHQAWGSGFMSRAGTTGLIRVDIRP